MTDETTIDYEALELSARRFIVRSVLERVAKTGLPGGHHFYIAFSTQMPGISMSKRLKERYPADMTIVLQHRFWDLIVTEDRFEVKLTFESIPERLVIPFAAIRQFYDPSVPYGMQFDDLMVIDDGRNAPRRPANRRNAREEERQPPRPKPAAEGDVLTLTPVASPQPTPIRPAQTADDDQSEEQTTRRKPQRRSRTESADRDVAAAKAGAAGAREADQSTTNDAKDEPGTSAAKEPAGANVVSLDKFRKK
jgi:uncharacterized protein